MRIDPAVLGDMPLFSTAEAEASGMSRRDLALLVRRGLIWRVARGWYSSRMAAGPEEGHILRVAANLRLHGPTAIVARHSAVLLHGLPLARTNLEVVEITRTQAGHGRTREGVRVSVLGVPESRCVDVPVPIVGGVARVVDPATAIVGTAMTNHPSAALVAGDHALRQGRCTRAQLRETLEIHRGCQGIGAAREALRHLEPRHESPGETLTAAVLRRWPWAFDPQVEVWARGRRYRLDFALREHRIAIEFDGAVKYTGPEVIEDQLEREADLRAAGWIIVRFTWEDLDDEGEMLRRLTAAVEMARTEA